MSPSPVIPSRAFLFPGFESFYVLQWFMSVDAGLPRQGGFNPDDFDCRGRYGALVAWWRWIKKPVTENHRPDCLIWNGVQRTPWLKHLTIRHRTWNSLWVKYLWTKASIRYSPIQAALLNRWVDPITFLYYCKAPIMAGVDGIKPPSADLESAVLLNWTKLLKRCR